MTLHSRWRRSAARPLTLIPLLATLFLAACAGAASPPAGRPVAGAPLAPTPGPTTAPGDGEQVTRDDALIIRTGQVELEVTDLTAAVAAGRDAIGRLGGYVEASEERHDDHAEWAQVTYRLPVDQWDAALAAIRPLGKVITESTDARDVTAQVVDLDARLDNLAATEQALQAIMDRATTIEDVLAVQRELTDVRSEIERLTAQRDNLADQAALSTLTVTYSVPVEPVSQAAGGWDLGHEVSSALAALVIILQRLASFGIWLAIVVVPIVLPVLVVIYLAYRFAKRRAQPA